MNVMVFGLGLSGISASRLSLSLGHSTTGVDRIPEAARKIVDGRFNFITEEAAVSSIRGFDLMILSPGIPCDHPLVRAARSNGIQIMGEIEWGYINCRGRIVGITGSNGKSTTTALAHTLVKAGGMDARLGGNIGTAFCDIVAGSSGNTVFVLELSSFQLETVSRFRADVAVILNITPDHQDRYDGIAAYAEAKARILEGQDGDCSTILNLNDPVVNEVAKRAKGHKYFFSLEPHGHPGVFLSGKEVIYRDPAGKTAGLFSAEDLAIRGPHNMENAMAASVAAVLCGADPAGISEGLRGFRALPHRLELVSTAGGVSVYNDSKATNTDSVLKALASFGGNIILLLGGKDKGADFTVLSLEIRKRCKKVIAFGAAADNVVRQLGGEFDIRSFPTLKEATASALLSARSGDTVLLSPACASFDEFMNYEDRGDRFRDYVAEELAK